MPAPGIRRRLARGARAQVLAHGVRVVVQVGGVALLTGAWGLELYGEWLILAALPAALAVSDLGFVSAATNEMAMAVGRGDRARALAVFQAVAGLVGRAALAAAVVLPVLAAAVPVAGLLGLHRIDEPAAATVVVGLGLAALLASYGALLYGGFAACGRYAEGTAALAGVAFAEFGGLAAALLLGAGPAGAAAAMLGGRAAATTAMWLVLRRTAPWLRHGRSPRPWRVLRPLLPASLATGAFPLASALNVQGMVVLVGLALGPAAAAVFSTLRTLTRVVVQLLSSVAAVVSPEISRAFGAGDAALLRTLHRRGCQVAVWLAGAAVAVLALAGAPVVRVWTSGEVDPDRGLLALFLGATVLAACWYVSAAVLIATNRHRRLAAEYVVASALSLPAAAALVGPLGVEGAATSLVALEAAMLAAVLRRAIPAAHDTPGGLLRAIRTPPIGVLAQVLGLRRPA